MIKKQFTLDITGKSKIQFYSEGNQIDFINQSIIIDFSFDDIEKTNFQINVQKHIFGNNQPQNTSFEVATTGNTATIDIECFTHCDLDKILIKAI
jgi:hypothetical protein